MKRMMLKRWTITVISRLPRVNLRRIPLILIVRILFVGFLAVSIFQFLSLFA